MAAEFGQLYAQSVMCDILLSLPQDDAIKEWAEKDFDDVYLRLVALREILRRKDCQLRVMDESAEADIEPHDLEGAVVLGGQYQGLCDMLELAALLCPIRKNLCSGCSSQLGCDHPKVDSAQLKDIQ